MLREKEKKDQSVHLLDLLEVNVRDVLSVLQDKLAFPPVNRLHLDLKDLSTLISRYQHQAFIQGDSDSNCMLTRI